MSELTNPVDELTEEFALRWRNGERPSVEEYAARFPEWADEIRAVLPAVVLMEQLKPRREDATPMSSPAVGADRLPERIGEYRIVREIGRGGMGVVYEAEQEALHRRVAVKVLPGHLLANEKLRARFHLEARAAARLHHTNIVPVFGVGEAEGQCFYVMQLINGRGLDQIIRETTAARGEAANAGNPATIPWEPPTPTAATASGAAEDALPNSETIVTGSATRSPYAGLAPREFCNTVARIGSQVADALAYAHLQGVLHRDVKPSNLLLDEQGAVWVTDFGVAKIVEGANLTQSGDLVGTLKYMPPERFAGQSDGRGDVYSLGITLYELLTLRSAFPETTPQHLIRLITQEAPIRPRKLNPIIPKDLETIVLKAAARDPDQRYQTPGELAEDLRRFLYDRPILAKRTGAAEQAWRWCRRNPALASAAAVAFLLMVAVTVVSTIAYIQTAAANRAAGNALAAEKTQREHAERTATLSLAALNRIYDHFAPTRLVVTPPATSDEGVELPPQPAALPPDAIPLLEDLLRTYEEIALSGGEFPTLRAQAAEADHRIGDIRRRLGRFEDAAAAYRNAIELYTHLLSDSAGDAVRIKLARAYNELGRTLRTLHQLDEAGQMHESAIRTLSAASKEFAERPECRYELACSYYTLGQRDTFLTPGRPGADRPRPQGEPGREPRRDERDRPPSADRPPGPRLEPSENQSIRRAVELLEPLVREHRTVPEYRHLLACCYRDSPSDRPGPGRQPPNRNNERGVELLRQLVADFPKVPDYRFDLCETLGRQGPNGPPGDADSQAKHLERLREAIQLSGEMIAQYPNVPEYTAAHARYLDQLGMRLVQAKKPEEAEKLHRKAVDFQTRLVKQHPEVLAYSLWLGLMERSLGQALGERGELKEARSRIEAAIERVEALLKKDSRLGGVRPFLGLAYRDLARVHTKAGEAALAAEASRKAAQFGRDGGPGGPRDREKGRP